MGVVVGRAYDHNWVKVRPAILARDGRCMVGGPRCTGAAEEVDHIVPLIEGGARLDPDNLRASCRPCNAGRYNRRVAQLTAALADTAAPSAQRW